MQALNDSPYRRFDPPVPGTFAAAIAMAAILVLALCPGAAGAKAHAGGTLSGSTSQGNPGWIKVSRSGLRIEGASITIAVQCPTGSFLLPQKVPSLSLTRGGRFGATLEGTSVEEGVTLHIFETFSGKFNADRTSVWAKSRIHLDFQNPDGTAETCDSDTVTLHATR